MDNILILGGAGMVGSFIAGMLGKGVHTLTLVDLVPPRALLNHRVMDVLSIPEQAPELLEAATIIVFALPEDVAIRGLECFVGKAPSVKALVNTCSVQAPFQRRAEQLFPAVASVGINPMFAPTLDCAERPVVLCERRESEVGNRFAVLLKAHAIRVTRLLPDEHDRAMAVCQALPHAAILAFAFALERSGCDMDTLQALAPPPMKTMLSLVARVLHNAPVIYWDIQKHNGAAQQQRDQLSASLGMLDHMCGVDTPEAFAEKLNAVQRQLGTYVDVYGETCEALFKTLSPSRKSD
ncbi:prephenate dehydrogenase dimerization domain-containing protein [Pseudomonas sp. C2B4]|uniref:prephenate dehydrogenase dimerization domain-containing protein n=1 Tax=Pseudomonas sp. C2B4 TaxID=2735270 RepID=UPI0015863991|nr:prephenate dehydrogenase dimerization domain-containing protein [Pseudomonas sp. C2B4]NUU38430.1 prephenate dehydrogenase/arogenate dehydrogenase family protein [Pseudomonas sp. C2B4]